MQEKETGHQEEEERESQPERPPERPEEQKEAERAEESVGRSVESGEKRVRAEAAHEVDETRKNVAELFWKRPANFVKESVTKPFASMLKRFFGHFGSLDDADLPTESLKKAREEARRAAGEEPEKGDR